jgi:hypothetical protein
MSRHTLTPTERFVFAPVPIHTEWDQSVKLGIKAGGDRQPVGGGQGSKQTRSNSLRQAVGQQGHVEIGETFVTTHRLTDFTKVT